jgi:serine/threonine protein kinase
VAILGAVISNSELSIVLEYMPRGNLYSLLHTEKVMLDYKKKFLISKHIVEGIHFLHCEQPDGKPGDGNTIRSII